MRLICGMGVYLFLFCLVVVYSLYAPEGYIQIATHKYLFFRKLCLITAGVMIPLITLYYIIPPIGKSWRKMIGHISTTDIYMLLFLLVNIISFLGTKFPEEALWGTSGWDMGFAVHVFFVGIYFFISRFYFSPRAPYYPNRRAAFSYGGSISYILMGAFEPVFDLSDRYAV